MRFQTVDLHSGDTSLSAGAKNYIAQPLINNFPVFYNFMVVCLMILAIWISNRIYVRWQLGDDEVLPSIAKWFFGIILTFGLITFLKLFISNQDFSGLATPNIPNKPNINP
jgi:hypothetical protein